MINYKLSDVKVLFFQCLEDTKTDLGWNSGGRAGVNNTGAGLGLLAVREEELEGGDNAAVGHFTGVFHHVHPELEDVTRADLPGRGLLRALAQPLVVDKGTIAGLGVLEVKLAVFIPEEGMVARQNL